MIDSFDNEVERLRSAYLELDHYLSTTRIVSHRCRFRAAECASDILKFSTVFRDAHLIAVGCLSKSEQMLSRVIQISEKGVPFFAQSHLKAAIEVSAGAEDRLQVAYKALFYFFRAYQDALHNVILEIEGHTAGQHSSMTDAIDWKKQCYENGKPVAEVLKSCFPEYLDWFCDWRKKRNDVKLGASFSIAGPAEDPGIGFTMIDEKTGGVVVDCSKSVHISDVIEALKASVRLARIALVRAQERK